jgi:ABC-type transport system involved in multi-copper enzyme maturation permease subunit
VTQSLAILLDSLRELKSRSLFWIALGISAIVAVSLFGVIGFTETGWRFLWFDTIESDTLRADTRGARDLMLVNFSMFVRWWLCWGAIILALVSTSSILPGFLSGGAIEIALAKPISRLRLFVLKIIGALLFVLLQTGISVFLAYLCLGVRQGMWVPAVLWAIPLIVVQFIYIFSVATLAAVVTRSTLASLLAAILFWGIVSLTQLLSNQIDSVVAQMDASIALVDTKIEQIQSRAEAEGRDLSHIETSRIAGEEARRASFDKQANMFRPFQRPLNTAELIVPKTGDIQKIIAHQTRAPTLNSLLTGLAQDMRPAHLDQEEWDEALDAGRAGEQAIRNVNRAQSLGTSLAFSAFALTLACVLFLRRDF